MNIKNFFNEKLEDVPNCHEGIGTLKHISLFQDSDFASSLRFINYTVLPPDTSIGLHRHGNDEEVYVILEGSGIMHVDGETREVIAGDVVVNKAFGTHGLINNSKEDMKIFVFEVGNSSGM